MQSYVLSMTFRLNNSSLSDAEELFTPFLHLLYIWSPSSEPNIIIGAARSALFTITDRLGLLVANRVLILSYPSITAIKGNKWHHQAVRYNPKIFILNNGIHNKSIGRNLIIERPD